MDISNHHPNCRCAPCVDDREGAVFRAGFAKPELTELGGKIEQIFYPNLEGISSKRHKLEDLLGELSKSIASLAGWKNSAEAYCRDAQELHNRLEVFKKVIKKLSPDVRELIESEINREMKKSQGAVTAEPLKITGFKCRYFPLTREQAQQRIYDELAAIGVRADAEGQKELHIAATMAITELGEAWFA